MKRKIKKIYCFPRNIFCMTVFCFLIAGGLFSSPYPALSGNAAERYRQGLIQAGNAAGITTQRSAEYIIGQYINALLDFLGVIFIVLIIYGGFLWMTAAGNEDKVNQAKKIIVSAIIGLSIVLLARVITLFVIDLIEPALE